MIVLDVKVDKKVHQQVIEYLCKSKTARDILEYHQKSAVRVTVVQVYFHGKSAFANDYGFKNNKHVIYYNPYAGYEGPQGVLSPALAHIHELTHAYLHIAKNPISWEKKIEVQENYVVQNYENKISEELNEPVRMHYRNYRKVQVSGPVPPFEVIRRWA
ncbi:hypothetical protein MNBD_GAMMA10-2375 [hydrothermal vent metagenome]|uniref:Uncharacterized protein n=1 Tax=hydrothermal vent metagenome TaxID=652676 RepID=A0A3B0XL46_9ZZZZ